MTAETLKSFISLPRSTAFKTTSSTKSSYKRNICIIWICLLLIFIIIFSCLLGYTIWNTNRISELEKKVITLKSLITNMQKRLGLDYLDELEKFEEAYSKNILDDPDSEEGVLLDSYEDEHEIDHENDNNKNDASKNLNDYHDEQGSGEYDYDDEDTDDDGNIYDDNFYDDFEKFKKTKDIKEKRENKKRIARSVIDMKPNSETSILHDESPYAGIDDHKSEKIEISPSRINSTSLPSTLHYDWNDRLNRRKRGNYIEIRNQPELIRQITNPDKYREQIERRDDARHLTTEQKYRPAIHHPDNNDLLSGSQNRRQNNSRFRVIAIHLTLNGSIPSHIDDKHSYYNHHPKGKNQLFYDGDLYSGKIQQLSSSLQQKLFLDKIFKYENGIIRIRLNGIYLIYGQVYYHNHINTNGFNIFQNNEPILQCMITIPTSVYHHHHDVNPKSNTCFTSGITYLKSDDIVFIRDLYKNRAVSLKDSKSFLGLIRLG